MLATLLLGIAALEPVENRDPRETYIGAMEYAIATLEKEDYVTFLDQCLSQRQVKERLRDTSRKSLLANLKDGDGKAYLEALRKAKKIKPTRSVSAADMFRVTFNYDDERHLSFTEEEDLLWYMSF